MRTIDDIGKAYTVVCAEPGCGIEFYPSDPRAIWCNKHHFAALSRMLQAHAEGKPMLDAVADELPTQPQEQKHG